MNVLFTCSVQRGGGREKGLKRAKGDVSSTIGKVTAVCDVFSVSVPSLLLLVRTWFFLQAQHKPARSKAFSCPLGPTSRGAASH